MKFACAHCGRTYSVADEMQGRSFRMKCRACGNLVVVRGAPTAPHREQALPASDLPVAEANPFVVAPVSAAAVGAAVRTERTPLSAPRAPAAARAEEVAPREAAPPEPEAGGDGAAFQDPFAGWDPFEGERQETPSAAATSSPTPTSAPNRIPTAALPPTSTRIATSTRNPLATRPPPPAPPSSTWAMRGRMASGRGALAVGGAAAALALAGAVVLLLAKGKPDAPPTPAAPAAEVATPLASATAAPLALEAEAPPPPAPQLQRPEGRRRGSRGRRAVKVASEERQPAQSSPSPGPLVRPEGEQAQPDVGGAPSSAQAARVVAANRSAFESCIDEAVRRDPSLDTARRSVVLMLTVNPTGAVADPVLGGADPGEADLGACLKSAAELMVFPAFEGEPVRVEVPLSLGRGE